MVKELTALVNEQKEHISVLATQHDSHINVIADWETERKVLKERIYELEGVADKMKMIQGELEEAKDKIEGLRGDKRRLEGDIKSLVSRFRVIAIASFFFPSFFEHFIFRRTYPNSAKIQLK